MSLFRSTSLLLAIALTAACSTPARDGKPLQIAAPALPLGLDWVPADMATVTRWPAAEGPFVDAVRGWLRGAEPACVSRLIAKLDATYQLARGVEDKRAVLAFEGDWQRDEVEDCLGQVVAIVEPHLQLRRDGAITILAAPNADQDHGGQMEHLGWDGDRRIVWHRYRDAVEAVLDAREHVTVDHPLGVLLSRIDPTMMSMVSTADYVSPYLGVPAEGLVILKGEHTFTGRLLFETPADAEQARALLSSKLERGELSSIDPTLASQLMRVTPEVDGRELAADLMPILSRQGILDEAPATR